MQIIGYFLFSLALFYVFLLWQFPYEALRKAIILSFEESLPASLQIERAGPKLPLNLILENIRIQSGPLAIQLPDVSVQPDWLGFCFGKTRFDLVDRGNFDKFRGEYGLSNNRGNLKIQAKELEIQATSAKDFSLRVMLNGEARLQWMGENYEEGQGEIWFSLRRVTMEAASGYSLPPFLTLFDRIRAEVQVRDGSYHLRRLEVAGKDINRSFQGDFMISGKGKSGLPDLGAILMLPMK